MKILGIETSCDDIGVSIYDQKNGIIFNKTKNQFKIHNKYGGIVPNIASNEHLKNIKKLIIFSILKSKINIKNINGIACTSGPGLIGSLIIGNCVAKSISYSLKIPFYSINHIEGHLLSPLINKLNIINKIFPFIGLIISGGNTILIKAKSIGNYKIIGKTLDDSVGNLIDKVSRLLNLNYPGGPEIYKYSKYGIKNIYNFPKPMINNNNLNFSFSGLKTHIFNIIKNTKNINNQIRSNISLELQNVIINILINKSFKALNKFKIKNLLISGGVISNIFFRKSFKKFFNKNKINIMLPNLNFCTDNAAMISFACITNIIYNKNYTYDKNLKIFINTKWSIESL